MRAIKKVNNNVALCLDGKGREVIASGRGIGFGEFPRELNISEIERTFYNIDEQQVSAIQEIDDSIFQISVKVIDYAISKIDNEFSSGIVFTMADHINFTFKRYEGKQKITLPIANDIKNLYEQEYDVGLYALKLIKDELGIYLPKNEASLIALHLVNSEDSSKVYDKNEKIIDDITNIIQTDFNIEINKEEYSYSRFVTHMHYLIKRATKGEIIEGENDLYNSLVKRNENAAKCISNVVDYLNMKLDNEISQQEKVYLLMHILRLIEN